jgi:hypothetical protein
MYWEQFIRETYSPESLEVKLPLFINKTLFNNLKLNEKLFLSNALFRFTEISNYDLTNETTTPVKIIKRLDFENIDIAPYYPFDIVNTIVKFKDSLDNSEVVTPDPTDLEISCNAYGYFYDSVNNLCIQRGAIINI